MFSLRNIFYRGAQRIGALPLEIKGLLSAQEHGQERQVPFMVWDVSANGLGILLPDRLEIGQILQLNLSAPYALTLVCSVVWCELQEAEYETAEPNFRAGLITVPSKKILLPLMKRLDLAGKK